MRTLWQLPDDAHAAVVLGHGAGAGMSHRTLQCIAEAFARRGLATLRFDFPFIEGGRRRVDSLEVSTARIAEAMREAESRTRLPIWLGGHSFGGRMASHAVIERGLTPAGLLFCAFPLHQAGKPAVGRAAHLAQIDLPMLFLSGTRDALARADLLGDVVKALPRAAVHWLDTADHSYRVLKRQRARGEDVFDEMARVAAAFVRGKTPGGG